MTNHLRLSSPEELYSVISPSQYEGWQDLYIKNPGLFRPDLQLAATTAALISPYLEKGKHANPEDYLLKLVTKEQQEMQMHMQMEAWARKNGTTIFGDDINDIEIEKENT